MTASNHPPLPAFYRLEPIVFYSLLLAFLLPVWLNQYFVTGDGPCHVYNSKVLLDFWRGHNVDFYRPFYTLNTNLEPNWFSHVALAAALAVFPADMAEKLVLTGYVAAFGLGFRYLVRQVNPAGLYISSVGLLFVYHQVVQLGFYNLVFSQAFMFFALGYWYRHWGRPAAAGEEPGAGPGHLLGLTLLFLVVYFCHPIGLGFTLQAIAVAVLALGVLFIRRSGWKSGWRGAVELALPVALAALPSLLLLAQFFFRRHGVDPIETPDPFFKLFQDFARLNSLETMHSKEAGVAAAVAVFVGLAAAVAAVMRWRERRLYFQDSLLIFVFIVLWMYFFPPARYAASWYFPLRIQIVPYVMLLAWIALARTPPWFKAATMLFATGAAAAFLFLRMPLNRDASDLAAEYMECNDRIRDRSMVLVLHYDLTGHAVEGYEISDRIYVMRHSDGYLGADKSVVLSGNYEALRGYFPFNWTWARDPFLHTSKEGINFDHMPPRADISRYSGHDQGAPIDYVLMLSYTDRYADHPYTREIFDQLGRGYTEVHTSSRGRARLFERKTTQ